MKNVIIAIVLIALSLHAKNEPTVNMEIQAICSASGKFFDTRSNFEYTIFISSDEKTWKEHVASSYELVNENLIFETFLLKISNETAFAYVLTNLNTFNSLLKNAENLKLNAKNQYSKEKYNGLKNQETWSERTIVKNKTQAWNDMVYNSSQDEINNLRGGLWGNVSKYKNTYFQINIPVNEWQNAQNQCREQILNDTTNLNIKYALIILLIMLGLYVLFLIVKTIYKFIQNKISLTKDKFIKSMEEKRIRDIATDESIRSNIKRSIQDAKADDIQDLQDLINKAVANGDSETAQALLKILNNKKDPKD